MSQNFQKYLSNTNTNQSSNGRSNSKLRSTVKSNLEKFINNTTAPFS